MSRSSISCGRWRFSSVSGHHQGSQQEELGKQSRLGVRTLFIETGSPWENGHIESFNGKLRDELLNREIFTTLTEAKVLIASWRKEYNQFRPHSSLHYRPPAPEAIQPSYASSTLTHEVVH
jgi:transposase InsO family protein